METEWIDAHHFNLFMTTSAGTYVKEFVHGDRGRTRPNVGLVLGCDADILQLDVVELLSYCAVDGDGADGDDNEDDE